MTISEQDLRELLRERSDAVPASPDRADAVKQRVRRQRRLEAAAVSAGLMAVVVAVAAVAIPRVVGTSPTPVPPATSTATPAPTETPGPQVTGSATYDGIRMDTSGPATVHGTTPFTVTVTVTNTTSQRWRGSVDVGVHRPGPLPNAADALFLPSPATPDLHVDIAMLPDGLTELDGVRSGELDLAAGASTVVALRLERSSSTVATPDIYGWVPWLNGTPTTSLVTSGFQLVVVDPQDPHATCSSFVVSAATEKRLPDQLLAAATTTTTAATVTPSWTEVPGLPGSFTPSVSGADVDLVTLLAGLGTFGVDGVGSALSNKPDLTAEKYAATFVTYSGVAPVDITFTGTCVHADSAVAPLPMSGVLHTYRSDVGGILDCALVPLAKSLGLQAAAFCPVGSKARTAFQSS
jgi:hypothetical protein